MLTEPTCLIKPCVVKFTLCMRLFFRSQFRQTRGIVSLEKPHTYPDLMLCTIYETGSTPNDLYFILIFMYFFMHRIKSTENAAQEPA